MRRAGAGETFNIGGHTQRRNVDLMHRLREIVAEETGGPASVYTALIRFVIDPHRALHARLPGTSEGSGKKDASAPEEGLISSFGFCIVCIYTLYGVRHGNTTDHQDR
jgi:hypothetical protein